MEIFGGWLQPPFLGANIEKGGVGAGGGSRLKTDEYYKTVGYKRSW